uniref:Secreted protein n=1 Tax=Nelumbo nucifera TaxID=4432 RepID=A0A822XMT9_NELNU|nr:TPA_asm: hypothetical protein HUJ06_020301 [Nelumbo nucifera]
MLFLCLTFICLFCLLQCYIAPITGCRLYSKRDVYRYLRYYASNLEKDGTEMQSACDVCKILFVAFSSCLAFVKILHSLLLM